jgi:hypothetical protein
MQPPFITFLLGKNEEKIRQGVAVARSFTAATATDFYHDLKNYFQLKVHTQKVD